ncbi:D-amino acid dehydrogenase [Sphingomonas sp.]|uniref:D-amino acid dehydrogenase n=1 Tax=Sphingomonas sp. TaxID=28214 RepID=UPI0025E4DF69|nr:D-amino acid dehydrogenase [Sphingomonas sp.]
MRILIVGSGVIGVTSAYYLAERGHEVTVIDRQAGPGLETSFANAGQISPGYAAPWAGPGIPRRAIRWMIAKHPPLILRLAPDRARWDWLRSFLGNCTADRYATNKERMVRLATFSRDRLRDLRADTGIAYDERSLGTLQLFRTQRQVDASAKDVAVLASAGVRFEALTPAACIRAEPALANIEHKIAGGLRLPDDETGDCFSFVNALQRLAAARGVTFQFETTVNRVELDGGAVSAVNTSRGTMVADQYLLTAGSDSTALARGVGLRLPVYPVKGYSLTVPVGRAERAPRSTVMDETFKVAITRLGDRIRVGGTAEIAGHDHSLPGRRRATLEHCLDDLFPGAADPGSAVFWSGLRPMTPDGTPVIGPTSIANLWLNTGHGTLGWTMACGSGHVIADLMSGTRPAIDADDLSIARYR